MQRIYTRFVLTDHDYCPGSNATRLQQHLYSAGDNMSRRGSGTGRGLSGGRGGQSRGRGGPSVCGPAVLLLLHVHKRMLMTS
jgi:hypothetical protein